MMAIGDVLSQAKKFSGALRMLGIDFDLGKVIAREIPPNDLDQLDAALDDLDDVASAAGAECCMIEIPIGEGRTARAFVVISSPLKGELPAAETKALPAGKGKKKALEGVLA